MIMGLCAHWPPIFVELSQLGARVAVGLQVSDSSPNGWPGIFDEIEESDAGRF